jgi:hypothetical protein
MPLTRPDIDEILQALDESIAGAPDDCVHQAYSEGSQIFYDLTIAPADLDHANQRLGQIQRRYELGDLFDRTTSTSCSTMS